MEIATWFATSFPAVGEWVLALAAGALYFTRSRRLPERNRVLMIRLFFVGVAAFAVFAAFMTWLQYETWKGDPLSQNLLPPHQSLGYFVKYAGTHFWLSLLLSLIVSAAFYGFLRLVRARNDRFFEEGETELGAIAAFLVGWPRIVVFLPAAFLAVVIVSIVKLALKKGAYTTLGVPFLAGLAVALAWGQPVLEALRLGFLAVIPGAR